ncbi:MAG: TIR domain-containing protein [Anaerolineae bacterium]|nr:TIR domain-containing protein [Anaerolineae bacterium]
MPDIFISYSRRDKSFVETLVARLQKEGRDVWVDWEDIPFASDWWEEICNGIDSAQATVFVISPDSLESKVCGLEVNYSTKNKKRLIPILYRPTDPSKIPSEISHLNWIQFDQPDKLDAAYRMLSQTIDTDLGEQRQLTRLLVRAKEWEKKGHSNSLLLRGDDLDDMLALQKHDDLTDLQRNFLERSVQRNIRAQMLWRLQSGFFGGLVGMGFWTFSVFRSDILITPERMRWTIAMGGVFGLFIGIMALLSESLPFRLRRSLNERAQVIIRIVLTIVLGIAAWMSFWWFLDALLFNSPDINALVLGGLGLAAGFIARIEFKMPSWVAVLITTLAIWLPLYITFERASAGSELFTPLMFFYDDPNQVFTIGLPFALLVALGAHFPAISRDVVALLKRAQPKAENAT